MFLLFHPWVPTKMQVHEVPSLLTLSLLVVFPLGSLSNFGSLLKIYFFTPATVWCCAKCIASFLQISPVSLTWKKRRRFILAIRCSSRSFFWSFVNSIFSYELKLIISIRIVDLVSGQRNQLKWLWSLWKDRLWVEDNVTLKILIWDAGLRSSWSYEL